MNLDPDVARELVHLFESGATPARLVCHILDRHELGADWQACVRHYFLDLFGVPFVPHSDPGVYRTDGAIASHLNFRLLPRMIESREDWSAERLDSDGPDPWYSEVVQRREKLRPASPAQALPNSAAWWPQTDEAARAAVTGLVGTTDDLHHRCLLLSRLAERLQQKVNDLEARLAELRPAAAGRGTP